MPVEIKSGYPWVDKQILHKDSKFVQPKFGIYKIPWTLNLLNLLPKYCH